MPRPKQAVPTYRHHKASGQAIAYVNRKPVYLGTYNSPESRQRFAELIARLNSHPIETAKLKASGSLVLSVNELCVAFLKWAETHYRNPTTGRLSTEYDCHKSAVRILRQSYGLLAAHDFSPNKLRSVRETMISEGWCRSFINRSVSRVRQIFKWGVGREVVPVETWQALRAVEPLEKGRTRATERPARLAVPDADLAAVRERLSERNRDVFDLLLATGARPAEMITIKAGDIDQTGEVWRAVLVSHKNAHRGQSRVLYFGNASQPILAKYLAGKQPGDRLFKLRRDNFNKYLSEACEAAGVARFVTNQLRNTAATRVRDKLGIEHAQALLGHSRPDMTARYSKAAEAHAREAVKALG